MTFSVSDVVRLIEIGSLPGTTAVSVHPKYLQQTATVEKIRESGSSIWVRWANPNLPAGWFRPQRFVVEYSTIQEFNMTHKIKIDAPVYTILEDWAQAQQELAVAQAEQKAAQEKVMEVKNKLAKATSAASMQLASLLTPNIRVISVPLSVGEAIYHADHGMFLAHRAKEARAK